MIKEIEAASMGDGPNELAPWMKREGTQCRRISGNFVKSLPHVLSDSRLLRVADVVGTGTLVTYSSYAVACLNDGACAIPTRHSGACPMITANLISLFSENLISPVIVFTERTSGLDTTSIVRSARSPCLLANQFDSIECDSDIVCFYTASVTELLFLPTL